MNRLLSILVTFSMMLTGNIAAAGTYVYTGSNYSTVSGAYTTAMTVSGSFTTAAPLPPNLSNAAIGPGGANLVTSWSFNDGVNTLTHLNSIPFAGDPSYFAVSTNASGQVTHFNIQLTSPPPPNSVGQLINAIAIIEGVPFQLAIAGAPCFGLNPANTCVDFSKANPASFVGQAYGSAQGSFALAVTPAPMLTFSLLAGLALSLLVLAFVMRSRAHRA